MRSTLVCTLMAVAGLAIAARPPGSASPDRWWKGNTHTHTLWSDGNAAPEHVADWYTRHGYNFLVLSDHNVLSTGERWFPVSDAPDARLTPKHVETLERRFGPDWVELRDRDDGREMRLKTLPELARRFERDGRFIFIQGEEITDQYRRLQVHVNGLNLLELIPPQGGDSLRATLQRNLDAVAEQGRRLGRPVLGHVNHPNFRHSLTPEDVASIEGERFFEVYNGHRGVLNHGDERSVGTEVLWDRALTLRFSELDLGLLYGLATDDAHDHHGIGRVSTPGRGWVWVQARTLTPTSIIEAMRRGDFYASTGVRLDRVIREDEVIGLEIRPELGVTYTTDFVGTRVVDDELGPVGEVLATSTSLAPSYRLHGDELYVRARVVSSREHPNPFAEGDRETAWVQPIVGPRATGTDR